MSDLDDRLTAGLERLARPADGSAALEDVARRRRRYRAVRRARVATLAVAVVVGSAAGVWGLTRTFMPVSDRPVIGPAPSPTTTTSPSPSADPVSCPADGEALPESYQPIGDEGEADVLGDGEAARIRIFADEERPRRCRYVLVAGHPSRGTFRATVPSASWLFDVPTFLMSAEIDGEPGHELVVDFGGPGHPHRTGVVFTMHEGELVSMGTADPQLRGPQPAPLVPLSGEFAVGIDCAGEPGTIVATWGTFADGGEDDSRFDITRVFYRAVGAVWGEIDRETLTVEVGTERERWPELDDDPFRSCPR